MSARDDTATLRLSTGAELALTFAADEFDKEPETRTTWGEVAAWLRAAAALERNDRAARAATPAPTPGEPEFHRAHCDNPEPHRAHQAKIGCIGVRAPVPEFAAQETDLPARIEALCNEADAHRKREPYYAWVRSSDLRAALAGSDTAEPTEEQP